MPDFTPGLRRTSGRMRRAFNPSPTLQNQAPTLPKYRTIAEKKVGTEAQDLDGGVLARRRIVLDGPELRPSLLEGLIEVETIDRWFDRGRKVSWVDPRSLVS